MTYGKMGVDIDLLKQHWANFWLQDRKLFFGTDDGKEGEMPMPPEIAQILKDMKDPIDERDDRFFGRIGKLVAEATVESDYEPMTRSDPASYDEEIVVETYAFELKDVSMGGGVKKVGTYRTSAGCRAVEESEDFLNAVRKKAGIQAHNREMELAYERKCDREY